MQTLHPTNSIWSPYLQVEIYNILSSNCVDNFLFSCSISRPLGNLSPCETQVGHADSFLKALPVAGLVESRRLRMAGILLHDHSFLWGCDEATST